MKEDVEGMIEQVENTGDMRRTQQVNGKNVAERLKEVDDLVNSGKNFTNKDVEIAHKLPLKAIEMPQDETVGLDLMLQKVWNGIEEDNVGVIGLYGMGGAGKTTLSKRIHNELVHTRPDFNLVMWVVVSKDLNVNSIMDKIRKKVGIEDDTWRKYSDQDERSAKIYEVLKRRKFVLILDDIWEKVELNMIGVPHPKETDFQSKVLFTTRFEDVCAQMDAQTIFKVECLNQKEAFELFCKKVGDDTLNSHPEIPKLAMEMALECKGLPLALIVLGCAMAGKKSLEAWEHTRNNLKTSSWTALGLEKKVLSILKFSYDQLPDETHKNCFLYCALYPEDHEIPVCDLIDKWIGEGFLGRKDRMKSIQDMRGHGEFVIETLKSSCLLESVEDDITLSRTVKMHDVIRDMALWLARDQDKNQNKILVEGDVFSRVSQDMENVERISIIGNSKEFHIMGAFPNLTTLVLESATECRKVIGLSNIQHMEKLKVLILRSLIATIEIPPEIGSLVLLEHLSLKGGMWASQFPMGLKKLKNLKLFSLEISGGDLVSIPLEVISSLEQLRILRFTSYADGTRSEEIEFLEKLECLPMLEELCIELSTEDGLKKLLNSTKLQSCVRSLRLIWITNTQVNMQLVLEHMPRMKQLMKMEFWRLKLEDSCTIFASSSCSSLRMLQSATFFVLSSVTHLTWLKYAPQLQHLYICGLNSLEDVIKGEIEKEEEDKGRDRESTIVDNNNDIFSRLVELKMHHLPKLKAIHKTPLSFPSLRSIVIERCPKLNKLPLDSSSANKLKEIKGYRRWWDNLEWDDPAIKLKFQSKFQAALTH
ncbi:putative disease resistance protein [Senna tora]|uniref:Putative disease resistance protein n=1 Tax=Senna tora TaxID=362788 RepID=A0A835CKD7_9FABA|nr:putative disease resistance protein [Senna tora]